MINCPTCSGPARFVKDSYKSAFAEEVEKVKDCNTSKINAQAYKLGYEDGRRDMREEIKKQTELKTLKTGRVKYEEKRRGAAS